MLGNKEMKLVIFILKAIFWIALAILPLVIDYVITAFMVNDCMVGSPCLTQAMPLIIDIGLITLTMRIFLWPICIWFLGGQWIFSKIMKSKMETR